MSDVEGNPYEVGNEADVVIPITSQIVTFEFTATDPHGNEWQVRGYDDRVQFTSGYQTHELMKDIPKLHDRFFDQKGLECILIVEIPDRLGLKFEEENFLTLRKWAGAVRQSDLDQDIDNRTIFHVIRLGCCAWALWGDLAAFQDFAVVMDVILILWVFVDVAAGRIWRRPSVFKLQAGWWALVGVENLRRLIMDGFGFWRMELVFVGFIGWAFRMYYYRLYKDVVPDDQLREA